MFLRDVVGAAAYIAGKARTSRGRSARRPADDPAHAARSRPAGPARQSAVLRRPDRHAATGPCAARSRPPAPTTSPRRHRAAASSCSATPTTTATARGGCGGSRSSSAPPHPRRRGRGLEARLRDRRRSRRADARLERLYGARSLPPRAAGSGTSSIPRSKSTWSTEHEAAAVRERTHAPCGQLRRRPPRARGERRQLLPPRIRRDVPPARRAGLPRRSTSIRSSPMSPRPAASPAAAATTAVLYCLLEGGGPRAAQIIANNLAAIGIDVRVHCMPGDEFWTLLSPRTSPGTWPSTGRRRLHRPRRFPRRVRRRRRTSTSATPRSPGSPDPRRRAPLRRRRAIAYARVDQALVRDACPGSPSPTRASTTSSPPASAASSSSPSSASTSPRSASARARTEGVGAGVRQADLREQHEGGEHRDEDQHGARTLRTDRNEGTTDERADAGRGRGGVDDSSRPWAQVMGSVVPPSPRWPRSQSPR